MELIDKSALVAKIEGKRNICQKVVLELRTEVNKDYYQGKYQAYKEVLDFLDTFGVKANNLWHDAQGDDLPEIDREVIVLQESGRVCFGHRPNPDGYVVVNGEKLYAQTYGKGGWNLPDVKWWLDLPLPYEGKEDKQ